jgi:PAT family beta-lactamase induction signal transducer AmpG
MTIHHHSIFQAVRLYSLRLLDHLQYDQRILILGILGFTAGLPLPLLFSSLSLWLGEAGVDRQAVTLFSWAALGYSFKFVWAPLIDRLPIPWLTAYLGRRRAWLLLAQFTLQLTIISVALIDPGQDASVLVRFALSAVALGFAAATQDIVIDAYRIESAPPTLQGLLAAAYIAGYRIGMLVAGAGALYLATFFGSSHDSYSYEAWRNTYCIMAALITVGMITTLLIREPDCSHKHTLDSNFGQTTYLRLVLVFVITVLVLISTFILMNEPITIAKHWLGKQVLTDFILEAVRLLCAGASAVLAGWLCVKGRIISQHVVTITWLAPLQEFWQRHGMRSALLVLGVIGLYRIADIVLGVIANVFYQDLGFSKPEIAAAVKTFGVIMSIIGGFMGGLLITRLGIWRMLLWGALLAAVTNLLFVLLALTGKQLSLLYITVTFDNFAAGLASAALVAFLSSLTHVSFTAMQYALFSSLMTLLPKILGGYSGAMVNNIGYPSFFLFTTLLGIPVLGLIWLLQRDQAARDRVENGVARP